MPVIPRFCLTLLLCVAPLSAVAQSPNPQVKRADDWFYQKQYDRALADYQAYVQRDPNRGDYIDFLTTLLQTPRSSRHLAALYRVVTQNYSSRSLLFMSLGDTLHSQRQYPDAIAAYQTAIRLKPDQAWHYERLGGVFNDAQNYENAVSAYRRATRLDPNSTYAYLGLAMALTQTDDVQGAIAAYRNAIQLDTDNVLGHEGLRTTLTQRQQLDQAPQIYRQLLDRDPDNGTLYYYLGRIHVALRQPQDAIKAYRQALQLDSHYAQELIAKGAVNAPRNSELNASYRVEVAGFRALVYTELASVLRQQGDLKAARTEYQRAIALNPKLEAAKLGLQAIEQLLQVNGQ